MATQRIDQEIRRIDNAICRHINNIERDGRAYVSQDVVTDLRHLTEHIMLKIYANNQDLEDNYANLCDGISYVESKGEYKNLRRFHDFLQMVVSHYKPDEENSERLMLKYYDYLYDVRELLRTDYNFEILHNLEKFPRDLDPKLQEYYDKIAEEIERFSVVENGIKGSRFYIQKVKPFYANGKRYYEVTFSEANNKSTKTDRMIAFTKIPIMSNYASRVQLIPASISIIENQMPINIIVGWEIAIRECEFMNFCSIFNGVRGDVGKSETGAFCRYMTRHGINFLDIVEFGDDKFNKLITTVKERAQVHVFINSLIKCRDIIKSHRPGENVLRLLLYSMNNELIKSQIYLGTKNNNLSGMYLKNGCIPFDRIPFNFSPVDHNVRYSHLLQCIDYKDKISQLVARHIKSNSEVDGLLFTSLKELEGYGNIEELKEQYNNSLYPGHRPQAEIRIQNGHAFIYSYVEDCKYIVKKLTELSQTGVQNYSATVSAWLNSDNNSVDCDEKKEVLKSMFAQSKVGIVYGSAGTGKTTLIKHLSQFLSNKDKLFLAQTNPAVDNLKRKVDVANCTYSTISSFVASNFVRTTYDVLIIDECSTVSNRDMRRILDKATFKVLVLVGDMFQIASIRFGNWFSIAKNFIPETSVYELEKPYRSKDERLLELWRRVRIMSDDVSELISRSEYSRRLDETVFVKSEVDEIILCLNYDGLYGINNINRFLQESNSNESIAWGIQQYKVGDPILFNESERFAPIIYNNMKGIIRNIEHTYNAQEGEKITFDIELDKVLNGLDIINQELELVEEYNTDNSVVRFSVYKRRSDDDDDDVTSNTIVPFQVAYAVSIHKAQGLEYDSVKIVISNEVDEMITHNIFYTAITRAKKKMKIYWSPEVQEGILKTIRPRNNNKDIALIRQTYL